MVPFKITKEQAEIINDLLVELSSELDLHYEDEDFFALTPTIEKMKIAANLLEEAGFDTPDVYKHVLRRFHRQHN